MTGHVPTPILMGCLIHCSIPILVICGILADKRVFAPRLRLHTGPARPRVGSFLAYYYYYCCCCCYLCSLLLLLLLLLLLPL